MIDRTEPLESRLYRAYWNDGLLDIFAGLGVAAIGVFWAVDLIALGAVVPVLLIPFWEPLRRSIVEPRAGLVEFSDRRTKRMRGGLLVSAWIGVALLIAFIALNFLSVRGGHAMAWVAPGVPALLLALLAALVALLLGLSRFFAYAAVLCLAGLTVGLLDTRPEIAMLVGGLVILLNGVRLLARFLRIAVEDGEAD